MTESINSNNANTKNSTNNNQSANQLTPEQEAELYEQKRKAMFTSIRNMRTQLIEQTKSTPSMLSRFSNLQINRFMKNPAAYQKELRQLSHYFYSYSGEYRQIIDYTANLPSWRYVLSPNFIIDEKTDFETLHKNKLKAEKEIDKLNLSHELTKVSNIAWKQDVFYGYEHESKDSFTIKSMNPDYCRLSNRDLDGVFLYEFDFSYFDNNTELLSSYPEEFTRLYSVYQSTSEKWQELSSDRAFAFKVYEEVESHPIIPYAVMFEPLFDLDEYKKIQKARAKMDNFMLLIQKIPMNDKNTNMDEFLLSLDLAGQFHESASNALGRDSGVGLITSPMEIQAVKTDKSGKDKDSVANALREVYNSSGISQFLFNSEKSSNVGVNKSIIVNEQKAYKFMKQVERWLNRKLKRMSEKYKMKLQFLEITSFDEGEAFDMYLTAAQNGFPTIEHASASLGVNSLDFHNRLMMNNYAENYHEMMQPLKTSHTQSGKDDEKSKGGRPTAADDEVADTTIAWRETSDGQGEADD